MNEEYEYGGATVNGFLMLLVQIIVLPALMTLCFLSFSVPALPVALLALLWLLFWGGFFVQQPNQARVMIFFGNYRGTFSESGFFWVNPFMTARKVSLRLHNMDVEPIKVNDKVGNPVMIGMVLVWKVKVGGKRS